MEDGSAADAVSNNLDLRFFNIGLEMIALGEYNSGMGNKKKRKPNLKSSQKANADEVMPSQSDGAVAGRKRKTKLYSEPSRPTVKRLFAVSGNKCAFLQCNSPLIDLDSGSIIGQICHIKGEKPGSKRFDQAQSMKERQSYENLILMCGPHHKVIDDDEKTFTVENLRLRKTHHETTQPTERPLTDSEADRIIANNTYNTATNGSIIQPNHQSGGQVAHTINNYQSPHTEIDEILIEGRLTTVGDMVLLHKFGCPGLRLTVVCKSKRPAKIRRASISAEGHGFIAGLERGYGKSFGHKTPKGYEKEILSIELFRISPPNSPHGYVLERDDVCWFFLPIAAGGLGFFLTLPPESVTISVAFFDETDRILLRGDEVQGILKTMFESEGGRHYDLKIPISLSVKVTSLTPCNVSDLVGTLNKNPVSIGPQVPSPNHEGENTPKITFAMGVPQEQKTKKFTLGISVKNIWTATLQCLSVKFMNQSSSDILLQAITEVTIEPSAEAFFIVPYELLADVQNVINSVSCDFYSISIQSIQEQLLQIPGAIIESAMVYLKQVSKNQDT